MDTNQNNSLTNTFLKGMDTDTSVQMMQSDLYTMAKNLRVFPLNSGGGNQFGLLKSIEGVTKITEFDFGIGPFRILAADTIRNYGVLILESTTEGEEYKWYIYRLDYDGESFSNPTLIFANDNEETAKEYRLGGNEGLEKLSIVCRYEDENNVKVYIADGVHSMLIVNILRELKYEDVDEIVSYKQLTLRPFILSGITTGQLKYGMVQYSYSLYEKNGSQTEASIPTKLIPIVETSSQEKDGKKIIGGEENKSAGIGIILQLPKDVPSTYKIKVYRIFYSQNGQQPTIETIIDSNIPESKKIIDSGQSSLETLTIEEYNSIAGIHIIPKVLESKFDYLFAANIKDVQTNMDLYTKSFDARSFSQMHIRTHNIVLYDSNTKEIQKELDLSDCYNGNILDDTKFAEIIDGLDKSLGKEIDCFNIYNDMSEEYTDGALLKDSGVNGGPYCRYNCRDLNNIVYGGVGKYIDWKFVVCEFYGDYYHKDASKYLINGKEYPTAEDPYIILTNPNPFSQDEKLSSTVRLAYVNSNGEFTGENESDNLFTADMSGVYSDNNFTGKTYANPAVSYAFKSLRRDELYRFGIILYNKRGEHSSVKWIADIRTPAQTYKGFEPFIGQTMYGVPGGLIPIPNKVYDLKIRPLGIQFTVNIEKYNEWLKNNHADIDEWSEDMLIDKYEIVRCNRTENDICALSQGVLSRPVKKIINRNAVQEDILDYPYTPTGLLTTQNIWHGNRWGAYNTSITSSETDYKEACNYENHTFYQFVSPEVVYQKDSIEDLISKKNVYIQPVNYLFNQTDSYLTDYYWAKPSKEKTDAGDYVCFPTAPQDTARWGSDKSGVFMQLGINLAMGMPLISHTDAMSVGKQNGDENRIDGIQLKSIFYLRNYVVCQYYSVYPVIHRFEHITAFPDQRYMTLSYAPLANSNTYAWSKLKKANLQETSRVFGYSKLYNIAQDLYLRKYSDNSDYEKIVGSKNATDIINLNKNHYKYNIDAFKIASEISWNEMFEDAKSDNKTTTNFKFSDTIDTVGNNNFINCVIWGEIDDQDYISGGGSILDDGQGYLSEGYAKDVCSGPGGRTALILISDDDNIFYKTIATDSILYESNPNMGVRELNNNTYLSAEDYYTLNTDLNGEYNKYKDPDGGSTKTHPENYDMIFDLNNPEGKYIYRNSIGGTYLCNIRLDVSPYGGYNYSSRSLNTYYSYGDIFDQSDNGIVFDGDCYIMPLECVTQHKYYYSRIKYPTVTSIIYAIPVETNINLAYTYGNEFSRNVDLEYVSNLLIEPSNVYNYYSQDKPLYNYNTVYSVNPSAKLYAATDLESDIDLQNTDYRCYYSNPKTNDENVDSWSKFMPINYLDVDSRYGEITNLVSFKDKLMFWQDRAVGQLSVNERAQVLDENNQSLILGSGGVLSRYDYIDQITGMSKEKYADTQSTSVLYWYDDKNKELKSYGNRGYENMNDTYHTDNLMWNYATSRNPILFYDNKYSEMVSKVLDNNSLAYNEKYGMFTSVYEVPFDEHIQFSNDHYLLTNEEGKLGIHKWNTLTNDRAVDTQGNVLQTYVQYVINLAPLTTKTFDNQEIVTSELPGYKSFDKNYFSTNHTYTWETDLNYSETDDLEYTDREGNFRYAIPRALDEEGNVVPYGNRMRGKYMICSITDKENKYDTSISYIITKFRQSWT